MKMRAVVLVPALTAAAGVMLAAQSHQPVFRSGVDLVRFDVQVTDGSGRPIADLRPDEIQVVEDGKVLPLLLFQHIAEPPGSYADAALRSVSAEVTTNQGSPRGHLYLLVFDQTHIAPGDEQIARRAAATFIKTRVRPSDRVAIVGLPGPGPALGFTADRGRAVAELSKVRGELQRTVSSSIGSMTIEEAYEIAQGNDRVLTDVLQAESTDSVSDIGGGGGQRQQGGSTKGPQLPPEDPRAVRQAMIENARTVVSQNDSTSRDFMERLVDLMEQYRGIEGRKIVVLFSEGFHQSTNLTRQLESVEAAAADTYAVFYSFDLNRRADNLTQTAASLTDPAAEIQARLEPLGSLATETDGALITDAASHLDQALDRIADSAQDYYLLGFTPSAAALASRGEYRRVTVKVTRPGAHVSARTGYVAPRANDSVTRRGAIDAALAAPFDEQGLHIDYTTYTMRSDAPGRARVLLALDADLPVRDANRDRADVVFVVRDARDGHVAASGTDTMPLPASAAANSPTGRSTFRVQFDVPPGSYLMRAVVREPGGLIGSADRRLNVRALSGPDVAVSDLVLGSSGGALPVRAHAYTDDGLAGMLEAYGRAADQLSDVKVTASLIPENSDRPAGTVAATIGELEQTGGSVERKVTFSIPLTGVAPGSYVARVEVKAGGESIANLSREVDISRGTAPPPPPLASAQFRPADILNGDFVRAARASAQQSTSASALHAAKGFGAFAQSDFAGAVIELTDALKLDQSNAAVAFVLGWANEAVGDHRGAIGAWRAAATIDPRMIPAHLALADAYVRIGQRALAIQALNAGLASLPNSPELHSKLAEIEKSGQDRSREIKSSGDKLGRILF